jgi:hypothetical protein
LRGRDELSDQRYDTEREEARVANDAYYGNDLDYRTYKANGGTLSEQAYNSIVAAAKGKYTDDHWEQTNAEKADADARIESYIHNGSWQWGDWNNDGEVNSEDYQDDKNKLFDGSSQDENYWKNIYDTYREDAKIKGYTYQKTAEGAAGIVNKLVDSTSFSLSENDRDNFDYIYGEGAYDAVQNVIGNIQSFQVSPGEEEKLEEQMDALANAIPGITTDQIIAIAEKAHPSLFNYWVRITEQRR